MKLQVVIRPGTIGELLLGSQGTSSLCGGLYLSLNARNRYVCSGRRLNEQFHLEVSGWLQVGSFCSFFLVWWRFLWWLVQQAIWEVQPRSLTWCLVRVWVLFFSPVRVCPFGRAVVQGSLTQFYVPYIGGESGYERVSLCWTLMAVLVLCLSV